MRIPSIVPPRQQDDKTRVLQALTRQPVKHGHDVPEKPDFGFLGCIHAHN